MRRRVGCAGRGAAVGGGGGSARIVGHDLSGQRERGAHDEVYLLLDLFGRDLAHPLRLCKLRGVHVGVDVRHLRDELDALDALHAARSGEHGFRAQGESRILVNVDESFGRHLSGLRAGRGLARAAILGRRAPVHLFLALLRAALHSFDRADDLSGRHHRRHVEARGFGRQLSILLAIRRDDVALVAGVHEDDLLVADLERDAAVSAVFNEVCGERGQGIGLPLALRFDPKRDGRAVLVRLARLDGRPHGGQRVGVGRGRVRARAGGVRGVRGICRRRLLARARQEGERRQQRGTKIVASIQGTIAHEIYSPRS